MKGMFSKKVNLVRNEWYDFGAGKGGDVLKFVMEQRGISDISHALHLISGEINQTYKIPKTAISKIAANSFSFRLQEDLPIFEDIQVLPLENPALIQYLQSRNIHIPFAKQFCKEVHYRLKDKAYFTIGFQNDWGGYELRNGYFQGGLSPKTITSTHTSINPNTHTSLQNENDTCCIFEGFMDYLSYLTLLHKRNPQTFNPSKRDYIVLNSVANVSKAIGIIRNYQAKFCYLDNDKGGNTALGEIQKNCGANVFNRSIYYREYKDLNDYLCGKKQMQKQYQQALDKPKRRGLKI